MRDKLDPSVAPAAEVQRHVIGRIDAAVSQLDRLIDHRVHEAQAIAQSVHEIRKHIKAARGATALLRNEFGKNGIKTDTALRDAARRLSTMRDAHAMLETFDELRSGAHDDDQSAFSGVHDRLLAQADAEIATIRGNDERLRESAALLSKARRRVVRWTIDDDISFGRGLERVYRQGRRRLAKAQQSPSDSRMHELRKAVKALLRQTELLEEAAPSMMSPIIAHLDLVGDLLGTDHDLAVLMSQMHEAPGTFGGKKPVKRATRLARVRQNELRTRALLVAETVYAEKPAAFADRIEAYWRAAAESPSAAMRSTPYAGDADSPRQRRFLVNDVPPLPPRCSKVVIGHLAIDRPVTVWIEDAGPENRMLIVAPHTDPLGHDLKVRLDDDAFDAAWPSSSGRRVHKTRYVLEASGHVVQLCVFSKELQGLMVVTANFESVDAARSFEPPDWFGREISDDRRYLDVLLATEGLANEFFD